MANIKNQQIEAYELVSDISSCIWNCPNSSCL